MSPTRPSAGTTGPPGSYEPLTEDELRTAAAKLKPGKAGGPDGVPPEATKLLAQSRPDLVLEYMNRCLREGRFPSRWKKGRLVLIPKPGKPPGTPGSYRPICLLDRLGKILERLILQRLETHLETEGTLS